VFSLLLPDLRSVARRVLAILNVNRRIGAEILRHRLMAQLEELIKEGSISRFGLKKSTVYIFVKNNA